MAMKIQVTEYYIQIIAEPADFQNTKLKGIWPLRSRNTYRCSLRMLPEVLRVYKGVRGPEGLSGSILKLYEEELTRRQVTSELLQNGPQKSHDFLWDHQRLGVELAEVNRRWNFYYQTRTGKTPMALQIMYNALISGKAKRCLVICPPTIMQAWEDDATRLFPRLKVVSYHGTPVQRDAALRRPCHVLLFPSSLVANNIELLKALKFDMCFFDESSKLKNYRSKISEATFDLSMHIPSWYNLSATPSPNGLHEYYIQMRCIDPYAFPPVRGQFISRYFNDVSYDRNYEKLVIRDEAAEDELMKVVKQYSLYVDQSVIPMSKKIWQIVAFELDPETKETYRQMAKQLYAEIDETSVIMADAAAAMRSKLNQIASGFIIDTEARHENLIVNKLGIGEVQKDVYRLNQQPRLAVFKQLIESLRDERIIIWANYVEEFKMLEELLGNKARYVRGGLSLEEKEQYIYRDFKKGNVQYLVCHPLSVQFGLNLTEAHIAIYYSLNDSWEAFHQSSQRICAHIDIQPFDCTYYILQATGTVNEVIYNNVMNKRDASVGFLEHLKSTALL